MMMAVLRTANGIAVKSPIAVRGTKASMVYARDHPVPEGLQQVAALNGAALLSFDLAEAVRARIQKRPAIYSKL